MGVMMPEVLAAADELSAAGAPAAVVCLTSADLVFRALQARRGLGLGAAAGDDGVLDAILPQSEATPIVTVLDGHPHTLSFLGAVNDTPISCLGVQDFGQSGDVAGPLQLLRDRRRDDRRRGARPDLRERTRRPTTR